MLSDLQQILSIPGLVFTLEVSGEAVIEKSPSDTWAPCCYALPDLQQILGMPGLVFTLEVSQEVVIEKSPSDTWAPCCYALSVLINFYRYLEL